MGTMSPCVCAPANEARLWPEPDMRASMRIAQVIEGSFVVVEKRMAL